MKRLLTHILLFSMFAARAGACPIPVFQYAMEKWKPSDWRALVVHDAESKARAEEIASKFQKRFEAGESRPNLRIQVVAGENWQGTAPAFPWLAVYAPGATPDSNPLWMGNANDENFELILNSPTLNKCAELLLQGDSAVWIFVRSGNPQKDKEQLECLEKALLDAPDRIRKIPRKDPATGEPAPLSDDMPLSFPILAFDREDPKEVLFLAAFVSVADVAAALDYPLACPVFGRGRALSVLQGDQITSENVFKLCSFLVGGCSCEIKEANPGMDLLVSADWRIAHTRMPVESLQLPPLPIASAQDAAKPFVSSVAETAPTASPGRNVFYVITAVILGIGLASCIVLFRK
jgi:hypothetical protein